MCEYLVFRVKGAFTSRPWAERLGSVRASSHAEAMQAAFEKYSRNYSGLAVVRRDA
jgi:hypothetical protein